MDIRKSSKRLAKLLTYILGRQPDEFGLVLDNNGFVRIKELLKAVCEEDGWRHVRKRHLEEILISMSDPPIDIHKGRIRAIDRSRLPCPKTDDKPPKLLYCCVRQRAYAHVREKGIRSSEDRPVRLTDDKHMALRIGRRTDPEPVLLTVYATRGLHHGVTFQRYGNALFLSGTLPADCLTGPPLPKPRAKDEKPAPAPMPPAAPGSFFLEPNPQKRFEKRSRRKKEISWKKERRKRSRRP
ncbi:hypothetical protein D3OALGA1CA_466 [Olavius algarvensis associated proteobacterium Delta 3]|nr:hypothetical protein D3OALGA1CA_466 [Olavius algarvensis associated proteobacterium Delta 3]